MAKTPSAFLGDYPILNSGQRWVFGNGTNSSSAVFELIPEDAEKLLEGPIVPVTLNIDGVEIKNLLPLVQAPTFNPNVTNVLVVDRRWYWQHLILDQGFNQRRHIGVRRLEGATGTPDVIRPIVPTVDYEPWSLQARSTPWDALEVLEEVMKRVVELEKDAGLNLGGFRVVNTGLQTTIDVENLNLSGTAATGIEQILRYVPTLRLALTNDGTAKFYSYAGADERKDIIEAMGTEMWDEGTIAELFTSFRRVRPKEVRIYFDIEAEVRFDFEERGDRGARTTADFDQRTCDNVLASTDWSLNHKTLGLVTQGNWVRLDNRLFESWGTMPLFDRQLTFGAMLHYMLPHHDFHFKQKIKEGSFADDADWAGRFQSVKQHWRTTYRINRRWVDAYRSIHPYRVATMDRATGHRAPAMCWMDYFVQGTQRLLHAGIVGGPGSVDSRYGFNVDCLSAGGSTQLDTDRDAVSAPAVVSIEDADQGIISYQFRHDKYRLREIMFPGKILNIPSPEDISNIMWNAYVPAGSNQAAIDPNFEAVFLMTLTPGTSGNRRHLFEVVIKPNDVREVLPPGLRGGLGEAEGPPIEIKVGAGIETARLAWSDRYAEDTEALFGFGDQSKGPNKSNIEYLCINYKKNNKGASIWSIAVAAAAQVYAGYADRHQGAAVTAINKDVEMTGLMQEMSHGIDGDGSAVTRVAMEFWSDFSIDPKSLMPAATRRFIDKIAGVAR